MAHTPGPWTIGDVQWIMHQQSGLGYSYRPINAGSWELAQVWEDDHDAEMAANVHLVAAAPALLAILKECRDAARELDDEHANWRTLDATYVDSIISGIWRVADAIIAKAEGRTDD